MRDYGKVFTSIWASPGFRALSEDGRALALYLLTCPHGTITGTFRMPDGYACEDLQWSSARVAKGFAELLANGFANRCETTKWVWICKFLEWNPPENPNQRKAASKLALQIADQCGWKRAFMRVCGPLLGLEWSQDLEPLPNPSETLSKPGTGTEAGIETPHSPPRGSVVRSFPFGFERLWEAYPKKKAKDAAAKAFAKRRPDEALLARMLAAVADQKNSRDWVKDGGQFIPHLATWLNEGRWQDEEGIDSAGDMYAGAV